MKSKTIDSHGSADVVCGQDKATPGPWTYEAEPNGKTFTIWHDDDTQIAEANTEEDARLIAALPDLLAALRRAVNHLLMDIDRKGKGVHSTDTPEALREARAAIEKATN